MGSGWRTPRSFLLPDALSGLNDLDIFSFDDVLPLAATAGKTDPDDIPETPKNPVSRVGDIWTLGKHRLMCGDATKPEHVERLLDGAKPDLMVTDPPYGVNYDASWKVQASGYRLRESEGVRQVNERRPSAIGRTAYCALPRFNRLRLDEQASPLPVAALVGLNVSAASSSTLTHHLGQGSHCVRTRSLPLETRVVLVRRQRRARKPTGMAGARRRHIWEIKKTQESLKPATRLAEAR